MDHDQAKQKLDAFIKQSQNLPYFEPSKLLLAQVPIIGLPWPFCFFLSIISS